MNALTFGSLFSGIGGIDLGFERAGLSCRWQVENNEYASKVLAKHWPDVTRFRDVREVGRHNLESVDVIAGGFPCQDVSIIGTNAGIDGERSGLWSEFARIVGELRPRYVVVENVSTLLRRGIERVLGDLASLGFDAEWHCIPASSIGAPHRRDRLFIMAYAARREGHKRVGRVVDETETGGEGGNAPSRSRRLHELRESIGRTQWESEPSVVRMADGVSHRVDRLKGLGNAVVPQVAELIGRFVEDHRGHTLVAGQDTDAAPRCESCGGPATESDARTIKSRVRGTEDIAEDTLYWCAACQDAEAFAEGF